VIHVVVPAFNEAGNVERLLAGISERLEPFAVRRVPCPKSSFRR